MGAVKPTDVDTSVIVKSIENTENTLRNKEVVPDFIDVI